MNTKFILSLMSEPFWKVKQFSSDKTLCIKFIYLIDHKNSIKIIFIFYESSDIPRWDSLLGFHWGLQ